MDNVVKANTLIKKTVCVYTKDTGCFDPWGGGGITRCEC